MDMLMVVCDNTFVWTWPESFEIKKKKKRDKTI